MKNKRRLKILALTFLATFTSATLVTSTIAWFKYGTNITFGDGGRVPIDAGAEAAYFAYGQGSSSNPFGIANRVHLYNLAWLQYIGYFDGSKTDRPLQPYFELANSVPSTGLDMDGIVLPPIGTDTHPFIGAFNGNNKTIVNLTVSNDDPTQVSSDFGVMKPSATDLTGTTNPEIIGFFGVVGALPNQSIANYSSSVVSVKNLTLKNLTVKSKTTKTLIGLAAGYVDGAMSGVKISGDATLDLSSSGKQKVTSVAAANNLSDYALVGYSKQTGSSGDYSQKLSKYYSSDNPSFGGNSWGGSFDSSEYMRWIYKSFTNKNGDYDVTTFSAGLNTTNNVTVANEYDLRVSVRKNDGISGQRQLNTFNSNGTYSVHTDPSNFNSPDKGTYSSTGYTKSVVYHLKDSAYLPLRFSDDNKTATDADNSGYLVGSGASGYEGNPQFAARYYGVIGNSIDNSQSWNSSNSWSNTTINSFSSYKNTTEVLTYSFKNENNSTISGSWKCIRDHLNTAHTKSQTNSNLQTYYDTNATYSALGLTKYKDSRDQLQTTFDGNKRIQSIIFKGSGISSDRSTDLSVKAKIFGETKNNYKLPKASLTFNIGKDGFVNFFAGSFCGDSSNVTYRFFSLYHVNRNSSNTITSLKRISKIYKNKYYTQNGSQPRYFYKYTDNTFSNILDPSTGNSRAATTSDADTSVGNSNDNYSIFDCALSIENTAPVNNALYYFEIPISTGEYAIGRAETITGTQAATALVYLDIAANSDENSKVMGYTITTESSGLKFPVGVDFEVVDTNTITTGGVSFCLQIAPAASGNSTKFTITSTNVTISTQNIASSFSYKGSNYSDQSSPPSGKFKVTNGPNTTISPYTEKTRVSHISVPSSGGRTEIAVTDVFNGANISSTTYRYNSTDYPSNDTSGTPNVPAAISSAASLLTSSVVTTVRALDTAITLTRDNSGLIATFNAVLPTMPWANGNLYDVAISSYPSGLKINASRTSTSYSLKINTTSVTFDTSNNGLYPTT